MTRASSPPAPSADDDAAAGVTQVADDGSDVLLYVVIAVLAVGLVGLGVVVLRLQRRVGGQ